MPTHAMTWQEMDHDAPIDAQEWSCFKKYAQLVRVFSIDTSRLNGADEEVRESDIRALVARSAGEPLLPQLQSISASFVSPFIPVSIPTYYYEVIPPSLVACTVSHLRKDDQYRGDRGTSSASNQQ